MLSRLDSLFEAFWRKLQNRQLKAATRVQNTYLPETTPRRQQALRMVHKTRKMRRKRLRPQKLQREEHRPPPVTSIWTSRRREMVGNSHGVPERLFAVRLTAVQRRTFQICRLWGDYLPQA
ncbi:Hypothetical predicted protein [Pelobates cultripes]|uniref:Uncharacterized protein n=1 Tax=Pelobates cultripes TaxID=61616 RepID=A0AAD1SBQ3_PELCU|nr:Hypothetical predicted protein [Pelobates cultripes]